MKIDSSKSIETDNQVTVKRSVKFGIRLKFFIVIISIILFVSLSIVFSSMFMSRKEIENEMEKRGISEAKNFAYDSKYGVFTEDTIILSRLANGRMKRADVVYVIIENDEEIILAQESKGDYAFNVDSKEFIVELENSITKTLLTTEDNETVYEFAAPIIMAEEKYDQGDDLFEDIIFLEEIETESEPQEVVSGKVKIGISLKNMETRLTEILFINIFIIFVVVTIAIIIALLFIKMMVEPIRTVAQAAMEIAEGDLTKVVVVNSSDEMSIMADNFNNMTTSLRNTIGELEELKDGLEIKVIERTNDLHITIKELEKAYKDLKKLDELKTNFISSVSHELRTPLTSIIGFAKLMKTSLKKQLSPKLDKIDLDKKINRMFKKEFEDFQEGVTIIVSEGDRLTRLVNDVLDIAKIEAGKVEWKNEKVDVEKIIVSVINTINYLASEKDIDISFENETVTDEVYHDKDKLTQVVLNLFNNAIKFTNKGHIICCLRNKVNAIEIEIKDTGVGISMDDLPYIFEKFKQVGNTLTNKPTGTGLGLPICKEIVKHFGGEIWVESEFDKGSAFFFTILTGNTVNDKNGNDDEASSAFVQQIVT